MFIPDIHAENLEITNNANGTYTVTFDDGTDKLELHLWRNPVVSVMGDSLTITLSREGA